MIQDHFVFLLTVVVVSISGVIIPGPLFATNVTHSLKKNHLSGIKIALGHTFVEFPLVIMIGLGVITLESFPEFKMWISIVGAISLFIFSALQIRQIFKPRQINEVQVTHGPILSGIIFTGANPFFILWWLTIGFKLISDAIVLWSISGVIVMFLMHIWLDYAWLGGTSLIISKARKFVSNRNFKIITIILSGIMSYYGLLFLKEGLSTV